MKASDAIYQGPAEPNRLLQLASLFEGEFSIDWLVAFSEVKVSGILKALEQAATLGGGGDVLATLEQARSLLGQVPRCVRSFTGRPPYVTTAYLSGDGRFVLSGIDQARLRLWDVSKGRSVLPQEACSQIRCLG